MTKLIEELEAAEAGSRELDLRIWAHFGGWKLVMQPDSIEMRAERYDGDVVSEWESVAFKEANGQTRVYYAFEEDLPAYTTSVDEALSLVRGEAGEVEHGIDFMDIRTEKGWRAYVGVDRDYAAWSFGSGGPLKANPAMALCIALLRALQAGGRSDG